MHFELVVRYLVGLLYALSNIYVIDKAVRSFREERYTMFGGMTSMAILNIFMMARMIFLEQF